MKDLFGSGLIDSTAQVWGLDQEDEQIGVFRPTGHPAVCYFHPSIRFINNNEFVALVWDW